MSQVLEQPLPRLMLSDPRLAAGGEPVLYMARALPQPGQPTLLVVAQVPGMLLSSLVADSAAGDGLSLTLERSDGQLLLSLPPNHRLVGQRLPAPLHSAQATGRSRAMRGWAANRRCWRRAPRCNPSCCWP